MAARKNGELVPITPDQKRRAELQRLGLCTSDHKPRGRKAESSGQCGDCCAEREDAIARGEVTYEELVADFFITPRKKPGRPRKDDRKPSAFALARSQAKKSAKVRAKASK